MAATGMAGAKQSPSEFSYAVEFRDSGLLRYGDGRPVCTFSLKDESQWRRLLHGDAYRVALAFIKSEFEVEGDLVAATAIFRSLLSRSNVSAMTFASYLLLLLQSKLSSGSSRRNLRFHYDRSNDFYRTFLDSRMVYSCAYFKTSEHDLEAAQLAKLEHICRKLQLYPGDRFLDVGCGWGALALHSAEQYGTFSTGCTLSHEQRRWAAEESERRTLTHRAQILECDYIKLTGQFDKVASVGMFEHVGRANLDRYFAKVWSLLADGGLFLNHGIVRPQFVPTGPETLFLARKVFPGGQLVRLTDVIRSAEKAGFEVVDVENLRPHYALTCKSWVNRLISRGEKCLEYVTLETYKTWLLYLAASAASFESGNTEVHQVLFAKRGAQRPLTREYMYV